MTLRNQLILSAALTLSVVGVLSALQIWHFGISTFPYALFTAIALSFSVAAYSATMLFRTDASLHKKLLLLPLLAVGTLMFTGILQDQWPCFMGVPNCD